MPVTSTTNEADVEGKYTNWTFVKAGVRAPGEGKADGTNSVMMKPPSQMYSTTPIYYNCYMASLNVYNSSASVARYSLEYSIDGGENWIKALTSAGGASNEVAKNSSAVCYWSLNLNNHQGAQFRVSQTATKDKTAYVDNFTVYYNGEEGGPLDYPIGDVNGDQEVGIADVNVIVNIILGGEAEADVIARADVNGDGEIGIADVNAVLDKIMN